MGIQKLSGLMVVIAFVAACGSTGGTQAPATGTAAAAGTTVSVGTTSLGQVLVGSNNHTLYGFTPDQAAGKPSCNGGCAATWPPTTVTGDFTVGGGLDKSKFKTVARDDGSQQLEIGNVPLYQYAPDVNPGDTNGQGVGGKWFAVAPDGTLIGQAGASAPAASAPAASPTAAGTY